jgi:hypothetical protein
VKAGWAYASGVERVPLVPAGAEPSVFFPGRPAAERAPDARRLRLARFLLLVKLPVWSYDRAVSDGTHTAIMTRDMRLMVDCGIQSHLIDLRSRNALELPFDTISAQSKRLLPHLAGRRLQRAAVGSRGVSQYRERAGGGGRFFLKLPPLSSCCAPSVGGGLAPKSKLRAEPHTPTVSSQP